MTLTRARAALRHWPISESRLELIAKRENLVFQVRDLDGRQWALRLHRPGYQSRAGVQSELDWMLHLQGAGLAVPQPLHTHDGALVVEDDGVLIDCLSWLEGKPLGQSGKPLSVHDRAGVFFRLGETLATLHQVSDNWSPPSHFQRNRWDIEGLLGEQPLWGRFWENPALTRPEVRLLNRFRDKAVAQLQDSTLDTGLIHADAVRENILIDSEQTRLIDFDDSGFGYRLFDVATALYANTRESDYSSLRSALLAGYHRVRSLDIVQLDLFMVLRSMTYVGWIVPRLSEPGAPERQSRFITNAIAMAEQYLDAQSSG